MNIKRVFVGLLAAVIMFTGIPMCTVMAAETNKSNITQEDWYVFCWEPLKMDLMEFPDAYLNIQPGKTKKIAIGGYNDSPDVGDWVGMNGKKELKKVKFSSSDSSVATIDYYNKNDPTRFIALTTAKKKGTTTLTATLYYKSGRVVERHAPIGMNDDLNSCDFGWLATCSQRNDDEISGVATNCRSLI